MTGITNFPAFLEKIKSKMNIFEFFKNLKAGLQFVLHTGQIVNNCVSDNPELPLSAAQGKILMDLINQTNGNLSNRFAINKQEFSTINDFPEYGSCFGVASQTLTLYEGFSIPGHGPALPPSSGPGCWKARFPKAPGDPHGRRHLPGWCIQ